MLRHAVEHTAWQVTLFTWIKVGAFDVPLKLAADPLTAVMLVVVSGVSFLVHLYSVGYMHGDGGYPRFFAYLSLFTFSMLMLVLSGNFLLLYVFWEVVGLCSYLLIGFWFHKKSAADAGEEGLPRQPRRRLRLRCSASCSWSRTPGPFDYPGDLQSWPRQLPQRHRDPDPRCCSSSAPRASPRSSRCTSGSPTPWRARRRSRR